MCGRFVLTLPPEAMGALFRSANPLVNLPRSMAFISGSEIPL